MKTIKHNGHTIKLYDSIETMPITVFQRFNLYAAMDAGIGGTIEDVDRRLYRVRQFINHDQKENATKELDNMRQAMAFVVQNSNPELLSFAVLIHSIDGKKVEATDEATCKEILDSLSRKGFTLGMVRDAIEHVKKKWIPKWRFSSRHKKTQAKQTSNS